MTGIEKSLSVNGALTPQKMSGTVTPAKAGETFANMLGDAINQVNQDQIQSNQATQNLIEGKATNLHNVMISAEKASISLTAAVEIRNKVISAYQTIMKTPI